MYQIRECRALGISSETSEQQNIFDEEEKAEGQQRSEEHVNLESVEQELQAMKAHVNKLQSMLMLDISECPDKLACVDLEVELNCSKNEDICQLQRNHHKLQCQVCELTKCSKLTKEQFAELRARQCQQMKQIRQLEKMTDMLNAFKLQLEHQFALCIERFEHLKHVKCEWSECVDLVKQLRDVYEVRKESLVPKHCYLQDKQTFAYKLYELKSLCHGLHEYFTKRFIKLEKKLFRRAAKAASAQPKKKQPKQKPNPQILVQSESSN